MDDERLKNFGTILTKDYFEEQMGCTIYEALPCGGRLQHL